MLEAYRGENQELVCLSFSGREVSETWAPEPLIYMSSLHDLGRVPNRGTTWSHFCNSDREYLNRSPLGHVSQLHPFLLPLESDAVGMAAGR